ncbi:hypothetical protein ACE6H2_009415 [Prunus campanulata]
MAGNPVLSEMKTTEWGSSLANWALKLTEMPSERRCSGARLLEEEWRGSEKRSKP